MARAKRAKKRRSQPDPIYNDVLVTKLINRIMKSGKKTIAQKHVYTALEEIKKKTKKDPVEVFHQALENIKPKMEVRSRRVGGATYQVPYPVRGARRNSLAIRWLVESARSLPNQQFKTFSDKLVAEIFNASKGEGKAMTKREEVHRMADANKAFAHFRW